jgi:hypothetical protein
LAGDLQICVGGVEIILAHAVGGIHPLLRETVFNTR